MKLYFSIAVVLAALQAHAGGQSREFAAGRQLFIDAEFKKAAATFELLCKTGANSEACYWTGLSYERLADIRIPFDCKIDAKAHEYFSQAMTLAPDVREYRDGFFNFLLDTAACSRTALREAAGVLSAVPESDPSYRAMLGRLGEQKHLNSSAGEHIGRLFLLLPRAAYRAPDLPARLWTNRIARRASGAAW